MQTSEVQILEDAIREYGKHTQVDMAVEEMSELTKALHKERRDEFARAAEYEVIRRNIIEEIADVQIMLFQLTIMFDSGNEVQAEMDAKLDRLRRNVEERKKRRDDQ